MRMQADFPIYAECLCLPPTALINFSQEPCLVSQRLKIRRFPRDTSLTSASMGLFRRSTRRERAAANTRHGLMAAFLFVSFLSIVFTSARLVQEPFLLGGGHAEFEEAPALFIRKY